MFFIILLIMIILFSFIGVVGYIKELNSDKQDGWTTLELVICIISFTGSSILLTLLLI